MKLTKTISAILWIGLVTCGCVNSVRPLTGSMGPYKVYRSTAQTLSGPNVTAMHLYDGTNAPQFVYGASGEGIGHPIIKAVGNVAGLATAGGLVGNGLKHSANKTTIDTSNHNDAFAQGGDTFAR
jgi:hypothetical protein